MREPTIKLIDLAEIVNAIPQGPVRSIVANHLAVEMNKRLASFSISRWANATGGKLTGGTKLRPPPAEWDVVP